MDLKSPRNPKAQYFPQSTACDEISPAAPKKAKKARTLTEVSCPICQEPVGEATPDGIVESWSLLPCGHKFGSHCIKHWLGLVADEKPCCPICRKTACHACRHPVLPKVMSREQAKRTDGVRGADWSDRVGESACLYCQMRLASKRRVVRAYRLSWCRDLALGCWQVVRHGRVRRKQRTSPPELAFDGMWMMRDGRDPMWEKWWNGQEPCSV